MIKPTDDKQGFTLIELLVSISIIGLIGALAMVSFTAYRASGRDTKRMADTSALVKALNLYMTSSQSGYPNSSGECLSDTAGAGLVLKNAKAISQIPTDPRWQAAAPGSVSGTDPKYALSGNGFCYYYGAIDNDFRLSFYLETDSGSLPGGINVRTPSK